MKVKIVVILGLSFWLEYGKFQRLMLIITSLLLRTVICYFENLLIFKFLLFFNFVFLTLIVSILFQVLNRFLTKIGRIRILWDDLDFDEISRSCFTKNRFLFFIDESFLRSFISHLKGILVFSIQLIPFCLTSCLNWLIML
jgi:hypothetical protein